MAVRLEKVMGALPAGFEGLRAEARAEGHSMLDTLADQWASGTARFNQPGEMLLAAYLGETLAGIGGITLEPAMPGALRMRRFYVALAYRRHGFGVALATALLRESAGRTITCNAAGGSERFWEALGFVPNRHNGRTHIRR